MTTELNKLWIVSPDFEDDDEIFVVASSLRGAIQKYKENVAELINGDPTASMITAAEIEDPSSVSLAAENSQVLW